VLEWMFFKAKLLKHGAVAQLGERMNGIHEVRGSIPLGSINQVNKSRATGW
jgi:hypothetical protein